MRPRFATGLVVGKFCPLHRGHQHLIDAALDRCERLLVVSYTKPEFPGCEPEQRERWLHALYGGNPRVAATVLDDTRLETLCRARGQPVRRLPHNDADGAVHREFTAWLCLHLFQRDVDAVFTSEDYGDALAAEMSRYARRYLDRATPVAHVAVDPARQAVSISGTALRAAPHLHWRHLAAAVAETLVERVVVLGGESSGKTTLAQDLAQALGTAWVPEYGRELWEERKGRFAFEDLLQIAQIQVEREQHALRGARRWLVCDTSPLTTLFYSRHLFGRAELALEGLARREYAQVLLCAPDFAFVQDGTRQDAAFRQRQHHWYVDALERHGIGYRVVEGTPQVRLRSALEWLGAEC